MTFMTTIWEKQAMKNAFFKTCFFCAYFRDLFGMYMNYSYLCNVK